MKICLNMIVKDEVDVIEKALASVMPLIDYWVIVDTGSTDKTQDKIREVMGDIPGELHERPWVNFGYNRQEALELAKGKGDYLLFIDADEELCAIGLEPFDKNQLTKACYVTAVRPSLSGPSSFNRAFLIRNDLNWAWTGVIHERLIPPPGLTDEQDLERLNQWVTLAESDRGARSKDPHKHYKDTRMLEEALRLEPNNARYTFYLALSYLNTNQMNLAYHTFEKRAQMQDWEEEVFWSLYSLGTILDRQGDQPGEAVAKYKEAFHARPSRAEPLFRVADLYYRAGHFGACYDLIKYAIKIPYPEDKIFVEQWVYDYGLELLRADCALALESYEEAIHFYEKARARTDLPDIVSADVESKWLKCQEHCCANA